MSDMDQNNADIFKNLPFTARIIENGKNNALEIVSKEDSSKKAYLHLYNEDLARRLANDQMEYVKELKKGSNQDRHWSLDL